MEYAIYFCYKFPNGFEDIVVISVENPEEELHSSGPLQELDMRLSYSLGLLV